ncbi:hypothetical protein Tco_0621577 [Tanacetum coccineum]
MKEERVRLVAGSHGASTTPSYSPRTSTPPSYSLGPSRNAECSNWKLLIGKIKEGCEGEASLDGGVEVSKHVNMVLGSNSATPNVVNVGLEAVLTVSKAHGIHSTASVNEENINDAGTINNVANNGTTVGPNAASNTPKDVGNVSVWVKLHGVPMTAFIEDGLSSISTKLGTPLKLDYYTYDMCIQSWGRSSYARVLIEVRADVELKDNIVFGHVQEECPKTINVGVAKNLKKPNQAPKGVPVGPKVTKKLIIDGKVSLVDDEGKPLKKVDYPDDHDSEDEVESIDNELTRFMASKRVGFDTNSWLKQWRDTYENADYDYDRCDDDMYEGKEIPYRFNLYVIVWISQYEVARKNSLLKIIVSFVV